MTPPIPLGVLASARVASGGGGGGSLEFTGSGYSASVASATQTIPGVPIGTPAANRVVVVAISTRVSSGRAVTGVTIGGVSATIDVVTTTWPAALIARAVVPSGATADIELTRSGTEQGPVLAGAYVAYGTVAVSGTARHYSASTTLSSASLAHAAGACIVACVGTSSNVDNSFTWGGGFTADYTMDRRTNGSLGTAPTAGSSTHANGVGAGPTTMSATSVGALYQGLAAAAYTIT